MEEIRRINEGDSEDGLLDNDDEEEGIPAAPAAPRKSAMMPDAMRLPSNIKTLNVIREAFVTFCT